jgi:SAM-dependent methyltransferase
MYSAFSVQRSAFSVQRSKMDLATFNWLLTAEGQALLAEAMAADLSEGARLHELTRLRRLAAPEQAAAAYETALLRRRAAAKFSRAESMYFTREALEQASGETIATYRARRYRPYGTVADLACGVGGDALALGQVAHVSAVDRDPLRLAMAAANARAYGLAERVSFVQADLEQMPPPDAAAIFFDPARRSSGKRVFALAAYHPPIALVERWRERTQAIGVKVAAGVGDAELTALGDLEAEFISVDGELKEAVLWFGPLAGSGRRATLLVSNCGSDADTQRDNAVPFHTAQFSIHASHGSMQPSPPLAPPAAYLYEPDPAVIRAHLVETLAEQIGAAQLDPTIAYLTADRLIATPFARRWRVIEWLPFGLKRLRARLHALDAGTVTVKKRGSPLDTDTLARQLSGKGARALVVVLTKAQGRAIALICEGPISTFDGSKDASEGVQ